jgi:hypothetical protein
LTIGLISAVVTIKKVPSHHPDTSKALPTLISLKTGDVVTQIFFHREREGEVDRQPCGVGGREGPNTKCAQLILLFGPVDLFHRIDNFRPDINCLRQHNEKSKIPMLFA